MDEILIYIVWMDVESLNLNLACQLRWLIYKCGGNAIQINCTFMELQFGQLKRCQGDCLKENNFYLNGSNFVN